MKLQRRRGLYLASVVDFGTSQNCMQRKGNTATLEMEKAIRKPATGGMPEEEDDGGE